MNDLMFFGRSAVFDRHERVIGYELRFGEPDVDLLHDHGVASAVLDLDVSRLAGGGLAFITLSDTLWADGAYRLLPRDGVVLQLAAGAEPGWEALAAVRNARHDNYRVALRWRQSAGVDPDLAANFDIVIFSAVAAGDGGLRAMLASAHKARTLALVDQVATRDEFLDCLRMGASYFSGAFFREPELLAGRTMQSDRVAMVRLVAELARPDVTVKRLNALVSQDVTLTYRLLRLANSGLVGLGRPVESIQQALVLLGLQTVRSIATLVVLTDLREQSPEVAVASLVRARTCESLATVAGGMDAMAAYTVGVLSMVDAVLGVPLAEALAALPLSDEVRGALIEGAGRLGHVLRTAVAAESGEWPGGELVVDRATSAELHAEAIVWTEELRASLSEPKTRWLARRRALANPIDARLL